MSKASQIITGSSQRRPPHSIAANNNEQYEKDGLLPPSSLAAFDSTMRRCEQKSVKRTPCPTNTHIHVLASFLLRLHAHMLLILG